ncbi:DUF924-domain-containing protein [Periconia macrospinosa]|uniref:DUF924-domain-containing protein n=1 Tax=Periconia macrospinosa TaxID=97972 RepID=A0A2V1E0X4_9PLEO|nr:DUF924-domain-containing protein [Periconia macrospinosa]
MLIRYFIPRFIKFRTLSVPSLQYATWPSLRIMNQDIARVNSFWFERPPMEWIIAPAGLDEQLKTNFSDLVHKARTDKLDEWTSSPEGSLALVVLLDQFSRNLFRGSPDAFTADAKAWDTTTKAIARGFDKKVTVIQASAFYLPLMHQESIISLIAARCLFVALKLRCVEEEEHKWVDIGIAAAERHLSQLERFGRYPTRNALLGRENTAEEEQFLKEHVASL